MAHELGTEPEEPTVGGAKIGRSAAGALQDQELLFREDILSGNGSGSASCQEKSQSDQQMHQLARKRINRGAQYIASGAFLGHTFGKQSVVVLLEAPIGMDQLGQS